MDLLVKIIIFISIFCKFKLSVSIETNEYNENYYGTSKEQLDKYLFKKINFFFFLIFVKLQMSKIRKNSYY